MSIVLVGRVQAGEGDAARRLERFNAAYSLNDPSEIEALRAAERERWPVE